MTKERTALPSCITWYEIRQNLLSLEAVSLKEELHFDYFLKEEKPSQLILELRNLYRYVCDFNSQYSMRKRFRASFESCLYYHRISLAESYHHEINQILTKNNVSVWTFLSSQLNCRTNHHGLVLKFVYHNLHKLKFDCFTGFSKQLATILH